MTYSRRTIENQSDRVTLEQAEARELFRNWEYSKNRDLIRARLERAERIYGSGARDRIRSYMALMRRLTNRSVLKLFIYLHQIIRKWTNERN